MGRFLLPYSLFIFCAGFSFPSLLYSQTPYSFTADSSAHIISGNQMEERLGSAVSGVGDVNKDGYGDFVAGAPYGASRGRVILVSGRDGQYIRQWSASEGSYFFGASVAGAGDINRDGYPDILIGDFLDRQAGVHTGRVFLKSGKDGSSLWEFSCLDTESARCGYSLAGQCDFDGDETPDFLIGADFYGQTGGVFAVSGARLEVLWSLTGPQIGSQFGSSVSCQGDADGDGLDDILVGAPESLSGRGSALVYSSATGELIHRVDGNISSNLGASVSFIGDIDGDDRDEFVLGAPHSMQDTGSAWIISGGAGLVIQELRPETGRNFGSSVSYLGDINADEVPDFMVGDPTFSYTQGRVYVFSGKDLELFSTYTGEWIQNGSDGFGGSLFSASDANADGVMDIVIGAPINSGAASEAGRVYLFYSPNLSPNPPPAPEPDEPPPSEEPDSDDPTEEDPETPPSPVCEEPEPIHLPHIRAVLQFLDEHYSNPSLSDLHTLFQHWLKKILRPGWITPKDKKPKTSPSHQHHPNKKKKAAR